MGLKERAEKYKNVQKGPLRTLLKLENGDNTIYYHQNGVGFCENVDGLDIRFKIIEKNGKNGIIQLQKEDMKIGESNISNIINK